MAERFQRLLKWVFFSVLIALIPIGITFLNELTEDNAPAWLVIGKRVLAHGELLLISAAIAADAVGDLIGAGKQYLTLKISSGGACMLIILSAALWYANIAAMLQAGRNPNIDLVAMGSLLVLAGTVATSGLAKFVAED
jgi:uncharacterized membrane protein